MLKSIYHITDEKGEKCCGEMSLPSHPNNEEMGSAIITCWVRYASLSSSRWKGCSSSKGPLSLRPLPEAASFWFGITEPHFLLPTHLRPTLCPPFFHPGMPGTNIISAKERRKRERIWATCSRNSHLKFRSWIPILFCLKPYIYLNLDVPELRDLARMLQSVLGTKTSVYLIYLQCFFLAQYGSAIPIVLPEKKSLCSRNYIPWYILEIPSIICQGRSAYLFILWIYILLFQC